MAALKENAIRSIGELADGWMPIFWPYDQLDRGRRWIEEGARKAGRDPADIVTAAFTTLLPLPGRGAAKKAREIIAFYIGGMGEYYRELLTEMGYRSECDRIAELYRDKTTRAESEAVVTDAMIHALTVSGSPLEAMRELRRRQQEAGCDCPIVNLPPGLKWPAIAAFIIALAPRRYP